jgi:ATP-dependent Lon protease
MSSAIVRVDQRVELPEKLPVVALRDLCFFPYMVLPLLIGRRRSVAALDEVEAAGNGLLLLLSQRDPSIEDPEREDLFRVGTVARAVQTTRLQDGTARVVLEGLGRARVQRLTGTQSVFHARVYPLVEREADPSNGVDAATEALARRTLSLYEDYARLNERIPEDLPVALGETRDRHRLMHLMAGHLLVSSTDKQPILEADELPQAYAILQTLLARELEILKIEEKIDQQVKQQMDSERRQFYLNEQLKAIHHELGETGSDEWIDLERALETAELPPAVRERGAREVARLKKLNPVAPEAAVIRTYVDWLLALPWSARTPDNLDVAHAAKVLDDAHYGLQEVKERILDHIAVLSLVGELQGPILCLVGPPGVGKTSLGRSIADSIGREFVRVSLGGVRDEAEIRGHRRTYVGALPGRILQGMRRSGSKNPVFLLDEVDKLAHDFHGDPGAALLEVLDPEQNRSFTDHYLEVEYDLSDVFFIATANTLQGIPEPLRDRMEVIRLAGYLDTEKRVIARRYLWPRQLQRHGLAESSVTLDDDALEGILSDYTREAGVRELERRVGRIARKVARQSVEKRPAREGSGNGRPTLPTIAPVSGEAESKPRHVRAADLKELLGPPPYLPADREQGGSRTGIANGLAWTAAGGEVLDVEVAVVPGSGEVRLTGTLGDVMKESAMAALTYARSRAHVLGLDAQFHERVDIHIHIPEGATPKDGPSAGITIAVALISALTGRPTRPDVAMTGEITLRGRVLGVGGVKEKAVAALRNGIRRVLLPAANAPELELLPKEVLDGVAFTPVRVMDDVLDAALETKGVGSAAAVAPTSAAAAREQPSVGARLT